jgi:hypothetical protein
MRRKKVTIERDPAVMNAVKKYYAAHPFGAAALRQPRIAIDHGRYIAYTQESIKGGMVGFGTSVGSALRAFDELYIRTPWVPTP